MTLGNFHRNLGLEPKPVFLNRNGLDDFPPKGFVASLHVTEVDVGQAVGKQGQQPISDRVPEIKDAMGPAAQKT